MSKAKMITPTGDLNRAWLVENDACDQALRWYDSIADHSADHVWETCPAGEYLLWWHERAGTPAETLAPVAYRAASRAVQYAADALEAAGLTEQALELRALPPVTDTKSARAAARAASAAATAADRAAPTAADRDAASAADRDAATAGASAAAWAAASDAASAADWAAGSATARAADLAAGSAGASAGASAAAAAAASAAEQQLSAKDCRALLDRPR